MTEDTPVAAQAGERAGHPVLTDATFLGAVALGLYLLGKCYVAARYSLTTASALLTASPIDVFLGSLTLYAYQLFPTLGLAGLWWSSQLYREQGVSVASVGFLLVGALAVAISPPQNLIATAVAFALVLLAHSFLRLISRHRSWRDKLPSQRRTLLAFFVCVAFCMVVSTFGRMWVPVEVVQVKSADGRPDVIVGHVLSADQEWTSVIRAMDRGVVRLHTDDVVGRQLCHLGASQPRARRPLWYVVVGQPYQSPNQLCRRVVKQIPGQRVMAGSLPSR